MCDDGIDNDGDTLIDLGDGLGTGPSPSTTDDCVPPNAVSTTGPDTDGDGSRDAVEIHIGTDPLARCGRGLEPNHLTPSNRWPSDLRGEAVISGDKVNITDLATFATGVKRLNTSPGNAGFDRRWDLRPGSTLGKWINVADMAVITTQNPPPMFEVRAFGFFSVCSAHPVYGD